MNKLKNRKAPGGCGMYAEMLKAGRAGAFFDCTLCYVPFGTRVSSRATSDGTLSSRSGKEIMTPRSVTATGRGTFLSVPGKGLAQTLLDGVRQKLLTHQRHEQSGFAPKKFTLDRSRHSVSSPSVCVTSALVCLQPM